MSGHFEQQAASDMRQAQATAASSRSGYDLGTAMYLGQQSIEKQLKAIIFRISEGVDSGIGTSLIKSFGHQLYPRIYRLYADHIVGMELPVVPSGDLLASYINAALEPETARDRSTFELLACAWNDHLCTPLWKSHTWKNHVGFQTMDSVLEILNSQQETYMRSILLLTGRVGMALPRISSRNLDTPLRHTKSLDHKALSKCRANHLALVENLDNRALFERHFRECQEFFSADARSRLGRDFPYTKLLRRLVMEFGFQMLISHAPRYVPLFLHNAHGRYPEQLDGRVTADMYESQADHVLYCVLVDIPYQLGQLRVNSRRLAAMLRMGHGLGCW